MKKSSFKDYKLSDELLKALSLLSYNEPTLVQEKVIPAMIEGKDIIVKSQTGSGKTAAFGIPICDRIDWDENKPQALVLTPTRELAIQVKEDLFNIGRFKRMKISAVFGKSPIKKQIKELSQKTHIVVGTPGRLIDHLKRGTLDTSMIKYFVIDEADEMLNMGFIEQMREIIKQLPQKRVTTLLSATMPMDIQKLCERYMQDPEFVEIEEQNKVTDRIIQERYDIENNGKLELLKEISIIENPDTCIIFCNTKVAVDEVHSVLKSEDYSCGKIHGGMEQDRRIKVMNDFRLGYFRYLIATDVAARGIDIADISLVINYDIPQDKESYSHRIGRTGRKDNLGKAITLMTRYEKRYLDDIEEYIGMELTLMERPDKDTLEAAQEAFYHKINTAPEIKAIKGAELNKTIMKLHINAGKKTKMRAVDIVGTLCNLKGMTADDIGIITISDISTFVEILNNKGEAVFSQLQDTPIKGRLRRVSKANS